MFTVIIYINHAARQFSATCRDEKHQGKIAEMAREEAAKGFEAVTVAKGLTEAVGKHLKGNIQQIWQQTGYALVTR